MFSVRSKGNIAQKCVEGERLLKESRGNDMRHYMEE